MAKKAEINKQGVFQGTIIEEHGNVRILANDLTIGANIMPNTSTELKQANASTNYNVLYSTAGSNMEKGIVYTYSGYFENLGDKILRLRVQYYNSSSDRTGLTSNIDINPGDKGFYTLSFTYPSNKNYTTMQLLMDGNSNTNITSCLYNYSQVKLEKGSVATPWVPNSADVAYSQLGFASANPNLVNPIKAEDFYEI